MVFEKKKIQLETLGEYLKSARENLHLTVESVSKQTGIKELFLTGLEAGKFNHLPADVYVLGFLRQLAQLYSSDAGELIVQYKKEKDIQRQLAVSGSQSGPKYSKYFSRLIITPKLVSLLAGAGFVILTVAYIVWQVLSINKTPSLEISSPQNNSVVLGSSLDVSGRTDAGNLVAVNNENIFVDEQGQFTTQIGLTPGAKSIMVTAQNRFGKATSQTLNVTAAPSVASGTPLTLKIDFGGPVTLGISIDGQPSQTLSFNSGDSKTFTASQKVLLSTSDAGSTDLTLNGQNLGAMGRPKEALVNVPFYVQTAPAQ